MLVGHEINLFDIIMFPLSDVNQCLVNNGGCDHTCTNELPGFSCSCRTGYTLDTDNRGCSGMYHNYVIMLTIV